MQALNFTDPAKIIKAARSKTSCSQREFAKKIGSKQTLICKYENGKVNPPASLVIHCMNLLISDSGNSTSESDLVDLVRRKLAGTEMADLRHAVAEIIKRIPE